MRGSEVRIPLAAPIISIAYVISSLGMLPRIGIGKPMGSKNAENP
jgi:hypothetical protein